MFDKMVTKMAGLALVVVCAGALIAPAAQATPIQFYNNLGNTSGTPRFTIGCGSADGSCAGLLEALSATSPLAWSSSLGLMLAGPSSADETSETNYVNGLLGTGLSASSINLTPSNGDSFEFQTTADYFMVKVGDGPTHQAYALLQNVGGMNLDLFFTATGQAGGLSHYITFGGTATSVPEPGALGLFGLGLLFVGAGFGLGRRRSA